MARTLHLELISAKKRVTRLLLYEDTDCLSHLSIPSSISPPTPTLTYSLMKMTPAPFAFSVSNLQGPSGIQNPDAKTGAGGNPWVVLSPEHSGAATGTGN